MGRITLTEEQKRIAESIRSGQGASTQQAPSAYRGGRITLNQKQIQIASKYGLPNPDYGKNAQSTQTTVDDPLHKQYAAFMAYQNAVREAELAQIELGAALKGRASGQKKTENAGAETGGKVSEQEYGRSSAMQMQYGTYQNYLRGVEAAQGRKLGTLALQQQSAALTFRPSVESQKDDVNKAIARARAMKTVERDQVRGMRRTSKLLEGEIYNREVEQADTHFSGTGLSENGKSVTQLQNEIEALQERKAQVDSQSVLARAQEAIGNLSEEDQDLLRQYRGKELNGYQVRAYAKYDAKTALNEKGYDDEKLKQLAEWQKVLDDYENAQKLDEAARQIGQQTPIMGTLFSAVTAPAKALGNVESLRGVLPKWAGGYQNEDMPTNVYSPAYNATRLSSGIRGSVMQGMNPTGQFLYQAGTSALDSAVNMAVSTGLVGTFGGVAGAGAKDAVAETMNWVMGSQVAADSVYEGIQNGKSNQEALIDGIVEGAIEGITEKYSVGDIIENMLSGKAVWRKALRSFASEGAEEIASNWLNRAYDVVAKHDRGEVMSAYAAYIADGKTPAQALAAMVGDFAKEDSLSFLAGGLSGLAMSGTYAGVNRVILEANVKQTARAVLEAGEVQDVIDYGMAQEEGTKAHQLAEELQQTVDEGGEVTQKAVENTLREVAKEQQAAVDEGQEPRVPETLTRLEQLQAQEQQAQAKAEADERNFQIFKSATEMAQENQRLAQQYQQEQEQNRAQQSVQAVQQAQRAAQQQYDQDSLLAPIPGTENMGELDMEQYARKQTAGAEQELDEAAAQQEEQYLQEQARRAGYDETTAAYFLNGNTTGMPAEQYAQSFGQVYAQGRLGASEQRAMRYAEGMNQDVATAAYRAGLAAGQKNVQAETAQKKSKVKPTTPKTRTAEQALQDAKNLRDSGVSAKQVLNETGWLPLSADTYKNPKTGEQVHYDGGTVTSYSRKGVGNGSIETIDEGQVGQAGQRAEGQAGGVRQSTAQRQRADAGRKRAQGARDLAKAWDEVTLSELGFGENNAQKVRVMPKGQEGRSEDIQAAAKFFRSMGVQNARFFTGQLTQEIDGQTFYADAAVTEDGSVLIRADSEEYSAFELAKHEGYHLLVKRWPEMAAKIQKRLLSEGKITKEMIESYVDAYAGVYGDDTDAYVEEIVADTYAGMNRTDYGTNKLRADVKMEVGQWQKKSGSARAPPVKTQYSIKKDNRGQNYVDVPIWAMQIKNASEVGKALSDIVRKQFRSWVDVAGQKIGINQRTAGEWTFSKDAQRLYSRNKTAYADKVNAFGVAGELLQASRDYIGEQAKHFRKDNFREFARGKVSFKVGANGYEADIIVGTTTKGAAILYDMVNITPKKIAEAPNTTLSAQNAEDRRQGTSARESISKTGETVKGKFSASADQTSAEQRKQNDKTALDYFGRTYKWSETGYVLLNGARLDFSGRHEGGPGGYRTVDHRDIIDALGEDYGGGSYTGGMVRFMQEGNIRISPESGGINLAVMPTKAQMDALGDFISKERGEVILDIDDAQGNTISSTEFSRGTHANKVLQAIRDYFENGTLPQADNTPSVSQFRYSLQEGRYRDLMGEKAAQYVRRLEARMVNELAENLSVPGQAKREVLRPMAEEALRTFFTDGQLDRAKLNDLFETAYQAGVEEDAQYIEQYGDLKKFVRDQKISISETDRKNIADYNLFRKAAMGTLTISKDGLPVDVAYQQLQEMAPELFPVDITAPSDQLMQIYDVARGIQKVQKTLDEYYGPQAASFKKWQQANFTESIDRLTSGLRVAQRYLDAQNKAKEKLAIPQTAEETKQMWSQLKDARRVVEKAQSKTLLTEADQKIVNRLLRGETSPDYVAGLENGQQILKVYEAKADYDMLALKLKAWNAQRKQGLREFAEQALTEAEAVKWVDKNMGIRYQRETMERNIRDIARKGKVSDEKANEFINKYFWPVHENESKRKNYLVEQQEQIRALKLDRQVRKGNLVSESYAVQWLGEAEFNRDYLKQHPRVEKRGGMTFDEWNAAIQEFEKQNPNLDLGKVRGAVKVFHEVYDKLFQDMNQVRIENGYEPVNYLQGYFPHFQENEEGGSILQKFARAAGIEGDVSPLPATINGLTANFKPGIRYMANIQNRLGYATAYDALQGFDRYIEVATDVIFHTADIQRLRALATQIRYRASDEGLKQRIDAIMMNPFLNPDEANEQVANLTKNGRYGLSNFVDELDEYTNLLAGKKSRLDRGMEKLMGRRFYNVMKKFESRVGANMVAANVGSALTNFIPITQAWSQVSTADVLRGMWDTLKNYKTADGLDFASTFINNRSGYGRLAMSTMDKVSAGAGWLMESIDTFTTGSVVRARYYQNLRRGMSETSAMQEADQFASGVMADRSKGSTPTLYSARNPLVKLFTQFQLEVNNELSWIFKDMAQEERKKGVAALAKAMFKFLIGAWIYNEFYESIVGRRAALDPLDIINDTVGDFTGYQLPNTVQAAVSGKWDFTKEKPGTYQAIKNLEGNLISELPGTQALTILGVDEALGLDIDSGRIAVASAIPNLGNIEKALLAKDEDMAPAKKAKTIGNELLKPGLYLATPFGGGQIRKAYQGATAAARGGSYSVDNQGRDILQYPVYNGNAEDRAKSWAQALLFGKTATEEAQSWVESGFKSLSAKETAAYQGMTEGGEDQRETYAFIQAARKLEKNYDKMMLLKAYDISDEAKAEYYYQVLAGDAQKAEMEPMDTQERIGYMNEKVQDAQDARQKQDLKDAIAAGTVTQEKAIQRILANDYAEDENKAYWLYREWTGGKDYKKYGKILQTIEDGGDLKAAAKEYFDHGTEKGDIGGAITTEYKPKYIAASPEERKKLKEKLLAAYTALGFDRGERSKDIDKWLKE
nr:MAG TPA: hypothetical protein [Caudoviricetes sp.]